MLSGAVMLSPVRPSIHHPGELVK